MENIVEKKKLNIMWKYVIATYLTFWIMVLGICGSASMFFGAPPLVMRWLSDFCAWSPTIVLFIMFSKLQPGTSIKGFYAHAFRGRIRADFLLIIPCAVAGGILISVLILSIAQGREFGTYFSLGTYPLPLAFVLSILAGPTGEESGWRGYLRPALEKRYGFLKAAVCLGVIWAFWHAVLWGVDSEFMDIRIIPYVLANVIVLVCLTIIMNVIMNKEDNLFYAFWVHFCFNFPYCFLNVGIWFYVVMTFVFVVIAGFFLLAHYMFFLKTEEIIREIDRRI